MTINELLTSELEKLRQTTGYNHDCYYKEGQGALFVPAGYELNSHNVVHTISERVIQFATGAKKGFSHFSFAF